MEEPVDLSKNNQFDTIPAKSKKGGRRPGAGRPAGKLNKVNEQRLKAKERFIVRVNKMVDELFNAQATIAKGTTYLYRVDKDSKGQNLPAELVTSPSEIKDYIDDTLDNDSYYYITTERPDNKALDSMLNRAFGKPDEHLDVTSLGKRISEPPKIISPIAPRHADTETDPTESN